MKTLPCFVLAIVFALALPVQAQTLQSGRNGTRSAASSGTVDAIMNRVISQGKHVPSSKSVLSNGWVRDWYLTKVWNNGAWENLVQATFTYDLFGDQISQLGQSWENSAWKNALLQTWTYDDQGNEITHTSQTWNGSEWSGSVIDTEMYNANGQRTSLLSRYLSGSAWVNQYLYSYAYDANGNETTDLCQSWSGGAWVNSRRWTFTYDTNGYYVNFLWEVWSNGAWVNYGRSIITNDANGRQTYSLQQAWNNGAWVNYGQDTFTYDGNGRKATDLYDTWTNNAWVHSTLNSFTYDVNGNKTDELEQVWKNNAWENATWYIDAWKKIPAIQVTKPATSEVVLAGAPYDMQWKSAGIDSLAIELSVDGGATFQDVARSVPADTGHYSWMVPDTLSTRCKLRISDLSDPSTSVLSGRFRVKGYRLTRIDANGDYEAFDPGVHGWQFKNSGAVMWPQSWWQQFSYFFKPDPITGQPYNNGFYVFTLGLMDSNFVDWPLFVRLFGRDTCYTSIARAVYSPLAVRLWNQYKDPGFRGSCFGFAVSSILAFEHPTELLQAFPEVGTFQNLHDLPPDSLRSRVVNELYEAQYGFPAYQEMEYITANYTVRMTLGELKGMLFSDLPAHRSLGMVDPNIGGHEVTPYRLQRDATTGLWNLHVYDCNCPSGDCHGVVYIDSLHNSWQYWSTSWTNVNVGLYVDPDPLKYLAVPSLWPVPGASGQLHVTSPGPNHIQATSYVRLFNSDASITITNATGQSAGFYDSTTFNGFSDGMPIIPKTGMFHRPIGYYVPSGAYTVRMYAFAESTASFSACDNSRMFTCWRPGADKSQADFLTYNNGLAIGNPNAQTKNLNLECITKVGSAERVFQVQNCPLVHNDSLSITAPDVDRLTFVNRGPQKTYGLNIELAGSNGLAQFTHTAITMPANSTHYILPDWLDLSTQPVKIYEDIGNTGVIHDTLTLTNQLTGVKQQLGSGIPQEFRLEQNYPNPFNPSTTIRYELPHASRVSLKVYNTLGQEVSTLVNETKPAGVYTVQFDVGGLASGVYFYRLQAGNFSETKKLVVLR